MDKVDATSTSVSYMCVTRQRTSFRCPTNSGQQEQQLYHLFDLWEGKGVYIRPCFHHIPIPLCPRCQSAADSCSLPQIHAINHLSTPQSPPWALSLHLSSPFASLKDWLFLITWAVSSITRWQITWQIKIPVIFLGFTAGGYLALMTVLKPYISHIHQKIHLDVHRSSCST